MAGHVFLSFSCLDSVSLVFSKTPIILMTPLKLAERLQELKWFYLFVKQMSVVRLLHLCVPPWNNRCKTRSHPHFTLLLSSNQSVLALFPTNLLIRNTGTRVVRAKSYFTEDILHLLLLRCQTLFTLAGTGCVVMISLMYPVTCLAVLPQVNLPQESRNNKKGCIIFPSQDILSILPLKSATRIFQW